MATDEQFDELMSTWLEETAPAGLPLRALDATFERTRTSRQQVRWPGLLRGIDVSRSILALGATAAIVVAAVVALSPRVEQPDVGVLPTTPDAWSRVSIDSRWATAGVDGLVAGPRGLLAFLGEGGSHDMQLSVSTDGRTWRLVPNDQFPSPAVLLPPQLGGRMPAVGTADGFLFVAEGNDVWASEDGYAWQRRADRARNDDLGAGTILAVAAGGPGVIAVGSDNKAWYSEDGADWTLAEVPAPPTDSFAAQGYSAPIVDMLGVVVAGDKLVAWGNATATNAADDTKVAPVLWTSDDGASWATVSDVAGIGWLQDVAAGPDGFVAIGGADLTDAGGIWFSADSRVWEPAEAEGFRDAQRSSPEVTKSSIVAASSGYVAVAGEAGCAVGPCPGARAVIWSSPDGMSWSRMTSDDRFEGAWATSVDAWDSQFVVAGTHDATPTIWISGSPTSTETAVLSAMPSSDPRTPFLGVWVSTSDGDGGSQRMTVERSADNSVEIVVTDTIATVCSGTSSTMTGTAAVAADTLVIPAPDYQCDDGTDPQPMGGSGLNEELRNLTYTRDAASDTLSVGIGDVWVREEAETPSPAPQSSESVEPTATVQPSVDSGSGVRPLLARPGVSAGG